MVGISLVAFWRGAWGLMDLYLFPQNPTLSFTASIGVGFFILLVSHYAVKELIGD